ncbi:MAG: fused MFS/spermidine synthase [Deltaproteobacteria bacterium]|nr:fused MFS/spermidine synthase [Deltaproteobacteria bacterium]MBW2119700.1 fused MFS/spermidine synthase [Deltaproteobacteria bacterium]MBW2344413.1 fused MFS/spermidine synthase [Deltaproteobacteria bacterium]
MINDRRLIIWSIIGTGISSVTTQLLTIREFLSQFHGNEITISLVLFCWLLLTGLGSLAAKGVRRSSLGLYTLLILIIAMAPLVQMLLIRGFREILFTHGTSPGFYPIFFYIMLTITPYCLLTGFILPYALKALHDAHRSFTSGDLYLTDSIGDITGGALFSFVLVYWLRPFPTIAITSGLLIMVALLLLFKPGRRLALITALALCSVFYYYSTNSLFEKRTLFTQYGNVVRYVESPYGRVVISKEENQHTIWESGVPLYSGSNIIKSEEKIHYPLCQLDRVENVLLVSGGLGETMREVAKYGPEHVDYVELDPYLTGVAISAGVIKKAPTLEIKNTDARRYLKTTQTSYDAIIVDLPDPDTFQINRFFTSEFFSLAKKRLTKDGILSIGIEYSPNYISDIRKKKLSTLYNTARLHFKNVMILPGEEAYLLMRDGKLWTDVPARLNLKSIRTSYVEGFFYGNVTGERIEKLEDILDRNEYANTDFEPRLMNIVFQEWFMKHGTSPKYFLIIVLVLTGIYLIFMKKEEYILFSTGLATMGVEMLIIFAFQVIYGYIYLKIGAIVTAFLLGLLPGALMGNLSRSKDVRKLFVSEMLLLFLLIVFFIWVSYFKNELHPMYFLAYCFLFSLLCGFQFPVAAGIIGERSSPAAGCLAADLCGASVGTLVTGTILIPLWGIQFAVGFLILVKISSSVIIMFSKTVRA